MATVEVMNRDTHSRLTDKAYKLHALVSVLERMHEDRFETVPGELNHDSLRHSLTAIAKDLAEEVAGLADSAGRVAGRAAA